MNTKNKNFLNIYPNKMFMVKDFIDPLHEWNVSNTCKIKPVKTLGYLGQLLCVFFLLIIILASVYAYTTESPKWFYEAVILVRPTTLLTFIVDTVLFALLLLYDETRKNSYLSDTAFALSIGTLFIMLVNCIGLGFDLTLFKSQVIDSIVLSNFPSISAVLSFILVDLACIAIILRGIKARKLVLGLSYIIIALSVVPWIGFFNEVSVTYFYGVGLTTLMAPLSSIMFLIMCVYLILKVSISSGR